jgi:serine/threonine protein kinase
VAIKILPEGFAHDSERVARFEREGKVLAALNHPNIAQIYGLEDRALIMELVEGPTLAERIAQGVLPLEEALGIARQIAEALEAAHEKGITHRDLKPSNVKITAAGVVKVLDFGLAAVAQSSTADVNRSISPTLTVATHPGIIMGTAAYMSPEQASGKPVDKRSDIWSFGVVLWEILTGKRLFAGETISYTLAAVLTKEPDFKQVPAKVRKLLRACLQKEANLRLQAIGDWRLLLEDSPIEAAPVEKNRIPWMIAAAVLAVVALALGFVSYRHLTEERPRVLRFFVPPPEKSTFASTSTPAVSPDGRRLAFVATSGGKDGLWVRDLDSLTARLLPGTDGASYPFWSPDSRTIAFFAQSKLKKIDVAGGPVLSLCNAGPSGGSWNKNNIIVFSHSDSNGLFRVPAGGGTPTPVTTVDGASGEVSHELPWFLPDDHHFLYWVLTSDLQKIGVYAGDLDAKARQRVLTGLTNAIYVPPGYLLFLRERTLMAQPFDASKLQTTGAAIPVGEHVSAAAFDFAQFSASQNTEGNSVLAYFSGGRENALLTWFDRSGKVTGTISAAGVPHWPAISPDGSLVAVDRLDSTGSPDIWIHDLARGAASRFTFGSKFTVNPVWSPDGSRIAFEASHDGNFALYQKETSGTGKDRLLEKNPDKEASAFSPMDWSKDGHYLIAETIGNPKTGMDIWVLPTFGDRKPIPYLHTEANERLAKLSPNGKWLAYMSDESNRNEVYIRTFPNPSGKWQVSVNGGGKPVWSRDGKELFFIGADRKMMAAEVKDGDQFEAGLPKPLFDTQLSPEAQEAYFDVSKDGRFLIPASADQPVNAAMTVVVNWTAGLKK